MEFQSPWSLLLLLVLPAMAYFQMRKKRTAAIRFSTLGQLKKCPVSWRVKFRPILLIARYICLALLIIAVARPRKGSTLSEISTEGVVIEVVVDHSGSMGEQMDYYGQTTNRLEVAKKVFADFIQGDKKGLSGREGDFVGLVTFARYADTVCPVVLSHDVLLNFLKNTEIVKIRQEDGTAIGDAVALAAARLKKAEEEIQRRKMQLSQGTVIEQETTETNFKIKNKIIILLTDGVNNAGEKTPIEAAELAKKWGIKIYTIGIGSAVRRGFFGIAMNAQLDERLLKSIAEKTGGFYGRATNAKTLHNVVKKIDSMEKTKIKSVQYTEYEEKFWYWALAALAVLAFEMLAGCTIFRKIP